MKKIIVLLLTLFMLASCKAKEETPIYFDDSNLHSYVEIKSINIKENKDTTHFDIEVESDNNMTASIGGEGDSVIQQIFSLDNGKQTCSFDVQNSKWPDDIQLFFYVYTDDSDNFFFAINKNNLKVLEKFTYISNNKKKASSSSCVRFFDNKLKSFVSIKDFTITDNDDSYIFHLEVNGRKNMGIFGYDCPDGNLFKKEFGTINDNNGLIEFSVKKDILSNISELAILIGDDLDNLTIIIDTEHINNEEHLTFENYDFNLLNIVNIDTSNYDGNFSINNLTYKKQDNYYVFTINSISDKNLSVMVFDPPDGIVYQNIIGETKGEDTFEFKIDDECITKIGELCIAYCNDSKAAYVSFCVDQLY